jgi:hypothetical protein
VGGCDDRVLVRAHSATAADPRTRGGGEREGASGRSGWGQAGGVAAGAAARVAGMCSSSHELDHPPLPRGRQRELHIVLLTRHVFK